MPASIEAPSRTEQVFISKSTNLQVYRCSPFTEVLGGGQQREISPGLRYQFEDGVLRVTDELRRRDRLFLEEYGKHHPPETDDPDEPFLATEEWLRRRGDETGGFQELRYDPPDPTSELQRIAELMIDGDREAIEQLGRDEVEGHDRESVHAAVKHALSRMDELHAKDPPAS